MSKNKEVWVVLDAGLGVLCAENLSLLYTGSKLAEKMGAEIAAIVLGSDITRKLTELAVYGAQKIYFVDAPELSEYNNDVVADLLEKAICSYSPDTVLFHANCYGQELAPTVAARMSTGLTAESISIDYSHESGMVEYTTAAVGNLMATILCPVQRPQMATVKVDKTRLPRKVSGTCCEQIRLEADVEDKGRISLMGSRPIEKQDSGLSEAEIVVVAGLGVGSHQGYERVCSFAEKIGAAVGASRAVVEAGWADEAMMVGQTGLSIEPKLCFELGVSGAIQHTAGISRAKCVVAVNTDEAAPVFGVADYGIIGDLFEFIEVFENTLEKK